MSKLVAYFNNNRFNFISWSVTFILVAGMILGAFKWKTSTSAAKALMPIPTTASEEKRPDVPMPALGGPKAFAAIER
ncbi:MAG TPA: hypothetical protein VGK56_13620, partial [Anaerolineales bacterium]